MIRWEQAITKTLLSPREKPGVFVKFNVEGLLRGDYVSRMNGYAVARQNGWMSANDIRALENLDRISPEDGGDLYLVNGNMLPLAMAGAYASAQPASEETPPGLPPPEDDPPSGGLVPETRVERRSR